MIKKVVDPNYPNLSIALKELTDNFYDTGLFECEWRQSRFLKVNHPYIWGEWLSLKIKIDQVELLLPLKSGHQEKL